jgi:hypothetical protein
LGPRQITSHTFRAGCQKRVAETRAVNRAVRKAYPSQKDFHKAIGKDTYRESPSVKPFFALGQQAHERWQEKDRKQVALNRELRMEFQALKMLINNINSTIERKAETNRLKVAHQLSKLEVLILKDALAYSGVFETESARLHFPSLLEEWADDTANLLMETMPYKTAVLTIQEEYFESHPILSKENEIAFEIAIRKIRDAIAQFNEYLEVRAGLSNRKSDHEQQKAEMANAMPFERENSLPIDIEAVEKRAEIFADFIAQKWVMNAKFKAKADVLWETGEHEDFVWEQFRKEMGLKS